MRVRLWRDREDRGEEPEFFMKVRVWVWKAKSKKKIYAQTHYTKNKNTIIMPLLLNVKMSILYNIIIQLLEKMI